ncbi:hypothetical protein SXCC_02017 [Gluconacetobacter sp. SXCC-1]|nr:hypothetical protein SXCC_02017 [Gluconacetobacter sp. SXCC-1]
MRIAPTKPSDRILFKKVDAWMQFPKLFQKRATVYMNPYSTPI